MSGLNEFHSFVAKSLMLRSDSLTEQMGEMNAFIEQLLISHGTVQNIKGALKIDNDFDLLLGIRQLARASQEPIQLNAHFKTQLAHALALNTTDEAAILDKIEAMKRCKIGILAPIGKTSDLNTSSAEVAAAVRGQKASLENNFQEIYIEKLLFGVGDDLPLDQALEKLEGIAHQREVQDALRTENKAQQDCLQRLAELFEVNNVAELQTIAQERLESLHTLNSEARNRIKALERQCAELQSEIAGLKTEQTLLKEKLGQSEMRADQLNSEVTTQSLAAQKQRDQICALESQIDEFKRVISGQLLQAESQ